MNILIRSPKMLGNAIQRKRKALKLSQAQLGAMVGLHQSAISLIEKGHDPLKLDTLLAIITALDLDLIVAQRTKPSVQDIVDLY
jgi:HTH-type transcriptional regulator / antitoxin HipB